MSFLGRILLGSGTLRPEVRDALRAEGEVLVEEGLSGSIRYTHFKAPGKRFHKKITAERFGLGISEERIALYCRSGRGKLIDTTFSNPRIGALEVEPDGDDAVRFLIDYDRAGEPKISGQMAIKVKTPNAATIVSQLQGRLRQPHRAEAE